MPVALLKLFPFGRGSTHAAPSYRQWNKGTCLWNQQEGTNRNADYLKGLNGQSHDRKNLNQGTQISSVQSWLLQVIASINWHRFLWQVWFYWTPKSHPLRPKNQNLLLGKQNRQQKHRSLPRCNLSRQHSDSSTTQRPQKPLLHSYKKTASASFNQTRTNQERSSAFPALNHGQAQTLPNGGKPCNRENSQQESHQSHQCWVKNQEWHSRGCDPAKALQWGSSWRLGQLLFAAWQ